MNCSGVQSRLSAYHDSELSQGEAARIADHLANCPPCAAEHVSFQHLSELSRQLTDPPAPAHMWEELQAKLDAPAQPKATLTRFLTNHVPGKSLALAATILVVVGMGAVAYQAWFSPGQDHLAMNFVRYLEEFPESPGDAQQILLAKYDGRPITLEEATNVLGYEPVTARGVPPEYVVDKVYLLNMPCCTCVQVICKNRAGQSLAIFEHANDQPVWFGGRPTEECVCHDVPTSVRQVGDRLAATWQEGKRYITIVGATDLNEVTKFVAHFKGSTPSEG